MSFTSNLSYLRRNAATTAVVLATLSAAGTIFTITKDTSTVALRTEDVFQARSGSGTGFSCDGFGSCRMSGSLTVDGVKIGTGGSVSFAEADGWFVNDAGDTMTGKLLIDLTTGTDALEVMQIISGASLQLAGGNITVNDQGAAVFNERSYDVDFRWEGDNNVNLLFLDASTDRVGIGTNAPETELEVVGTMSGRSLHAGTGSLTSSGGLTVEGTSFIQRRIEIPVCDAATACATGSGAMYMVTNSESGNLIYDAVLGVANPGVTGTMTVQVRNMTKQVDLFSTVLTLDSTHVLSTQSTAPVVINSSNNLISGFDRIVARVTAIHSGTAAKGGTVVLYLRPR